MKRQIIFTLSFIVFGFTANQMFAQEVAAVAKTAGYDLKKNVKCRVIASVNGSTIVFESIDAVARESTSGMATGKRQYAPIRIIKEYRVSARDNSVLQVRAPRDMASGQASGRVQQKAEEAVEANDAASAADLGVGKVNIQDINYVLSNKDTKRELAATNGECDLPTDLPDGTYIMTVSWSWGMSQSGGRSADNRCSVDFGLEIKDGSYVAINSKGLPGEKRIKKSSK